MHTTGPIGVFDSGVGGLSVLRELCTLLPNEDYCYAADSHNCPYGSRGEAFIQQRSLRIVGWLIEQGAKVIVVACNTATAAAAPLLRATYPVPIIAMEPAIKPAVAATHTGVIGVLATVGTSRSTRLSSLIERYGHDVEVLTQPCPGLVEQIEAGDLDGPDTCALIERYTGPLIARGADVLVLGCTHYPFLRPTLTMLLGPQIRLIDTGAAVARQTARVLRDQGLLATRTTGRIEFWTSADPAESAPVVQRLWHMPLPIQRLPLAIAYPEHQLQA
ncbi:MAG: glutamate racemase [Herpetosiphonaceae bacterium]|nr:glutamate racemase [Herpetosiphonaceae bacterium]